MLQINKNIKLIRELSGKTQKDFAKLIKSKLSNVKTYETSDTRPKAPVLAAICDFAQISLKELEEKELTHKDLPFQVDKVDDATGSDPKMVILPIGDVKRTLADYINMLELYNRTLTAAVNAGLIDIKDNIQDAVANSTQAHELTQKQILHSAEWLAKLMLEYKAELLASPPLKKGKRLDQREKDGDGKGKAD